MPNVGAIRDRLEKAQIAHTQPYMSAEHRSRALSGAAPYAIERVIADHWLPLLEEVTRDVRDVHSRGVLRIIRREEVFA